MKSAAIAILFCTAAAPAPIPANSAGPTLTVTPEGGIVDAPFAVAVKGVPYHTQVVIRATRQTETGAPWVASGIYTADAAGSVDAARFPSLGGTYTGVSPHGLLCASLPVDPEKIDAYIAGFPANPRQPKFFPDPLGRSSIELTASVDGRVVAQTTAWRSYAEGTAGEDVSVAEGWKGIFFPPAAGVKIGAPVLLLTGSGGGLPRYGAARLASHGHPAMAMAMYNYPGLSDSLVKFPIERVRDAAIWLAKRTGTERAVVLGISRGSEAAALAAVNFPAAVSGIILIVPSHLADAGALGPSARPGDSAWTVNGEPTLVTDLGFTPDDPRVVEQAKTLPGYNATAMVLDEWGSNEFEAKYGIPFEKIKVPILVLAAGRDAIWPSWISAAHIKRRLAAHGMADQAEVHVYPDAGHSMVSLGLGGPLSTFGYNPMLKGFMSFGGTPNGICEASFDSAQATLSFLDRLRGAHF